MTLFYKEEKTMKKINTIEKLNQVAAELTDEQRQTIEAVQDRLEDEEYVVTFDFVLAAFICQPEHARAEDNVYFSADGLIEVFSDCFKEPDMLSIDDYIKKEYNYSSLLDADVFKNIFSEDVAIYILHDVAGRNAAHSGGYWRQMYWQDFDYYADNYIGDYIVDRDEFRTYGEACDRFIESLHAYEESHGGEFAGCESVSDFRNRARELGYLDEYAAYLIAFKFVKQMFGTTVIPFEHCTIDEFTFKCLALEDALSGTIAEIEKQL